MSVENKIREMMSQKLDEAFPGMGKNKEDKAPSQGSSSSPEIQMMHKGDVNAEKPANPVNKLQAGAGPKESAPMKQGSSQDASIDLETDQSNQGKAQSAKAKKQPVPTTKGAGAAPNFTTMIDPSSVINQPSSKGNVHQEDVEIEEDEEIELISEEEFNSLSEEEQAEYVLLEDEPEDEPEEIEEMHYGNKKDDDDEDEDDEENAKNKKMKMKMMQKMKEELSRDVENLFASEVDLSEEFKNKASSLFEAVVTARVAHEVEKMQDALAEEATEAVVAIHEDMVSKIDAYLSYVAEQWLAANEVAVETGLRAEVTEDFISGLKVLFQEHYIEVPEEKYDVMGEMEEKIEELTAHANESMAKVVELNAELSEAKREVVFSKATSDLAQTEAEKLRGLIEEVEFDNAELFEHKISVIKNNYFPKSTMASPITEEMVETQEVSGSVAKYAELLSRNTFGK